MQQSIGLLWWRLLDASQTRCLGWYSEGWLGQYLVILPAQQLIIVHMLRHLDVLDDRDVISFPDLLDMLRMLVS